LGPAVNPTRRLHPEKYISLEWVIELQTKKGSYLAVFKAVEGKYYTKNSILGPAVNPTGRMHPEKYISLEHKHLAPGNIFV
jgi:hypothetical protein